jgi:hypothetical protein
VKLGIAISALVASTAVAEASLTLMWIKHTSLKRKLGARHLAPIVERSRFLQGAAPVDLAESDFRNDGHRTAA